MKTNFEEQISEATSLLDVLLVLKQKTMLDTHVATLAYIGDTIKPFDGKYGIKSCRPFPLDENQEEYSIQSYYFSEDGDSFAKGSMALVVFADRNFISNLQVPSDTPKETQDQILHSMKYGVIVSLPGVALTEEEKKELLDF